MYDFHECPDCGRLCDCAGDDDDCTHDCGPDDEYDVLWESESPEAVADSALEDDAC